ncbi:MAG TPA: hypothetical protein VMU81_24545 [Acetobacteraceae bacterium]|jgi:hypothetical protein|nr:hypothetical protein [Acetobacteraceae bacterium]
MDRNIVYPGSIPLDTDLLSVNRNAMTALGYLAQAVLGISPVVDGLACTPTLPPSMTVTVGPGTISQLSVIDALPYGSLPADTTDPLLKIGINIGPTNFTLAAPTVSGQSANYLIEAAFQESDIKPIVLPYYNAASPSQPYSGPANSGTAQNTLRTQSVQLQMKAGTPATTGVQLTPPVDNGWIGLYAITVTYGQSAIYAANIATLPTAPFISWKLPMLRPGFGSGVECFAQSGTFMVPAGVNQVEVEVWGGGAGSFASITGVPTYGGSGGGSGGGYARKRITGLTPGQTIAVVVGTGGSGGTVQGGAATAGGTSSFGSYVSATGGSLNYSATILSPQLGATPAGIGVGGDVNLLGSAGQTAALNMGGMGGAAPMGGSQNSGTTGVAGIFPGGGAAGAGTGASGTTPYAGAAGASGLVVVRW